MSPANSPQQPTSAATALAAERPIRWTGLAGKGVSGRSSEELMSLRLVTSAVLACLAGACATARAGGAPIPHETPFDASPRERVEYLHYYRLGYEAALTGHLSSRCARDEYWRARSAGWVDGQGDGFLVWSKDYEDAVGRRDRARLQVLLSGLGDFAAEALEQSLSDPVRR